MGQQTFRLDRTIFGRATLFTAAIYGNWAATYYSHEVAHKQIYGYYQMNPQYIFDEKDWTRMLPKLDHKCEDSTKVECKRNYLATSLGLDDRALIHGLVQQKRNARYQWEYNITSPTFSFKEDCVCNPFPEPK